MTSLSACNAIASSCEAKVLDLDVHIIRGLIEIHLPVKDPKSIGQQ